MITGVQAEMTDPYEIFDKYYEAMGGLDKFKSQKSSHIEGTIVIEGTGLEGTFITWGQSPNRSRQDVDLGVIKQVMGDNGDIAWMVDLNGKLQIIRDPKRLLDRRVDSLMSEFDHLDRNSEFFAVEYEGVDTAGGVDCYMISIANNLSETVYTQYYDTTTFLMIQQSTVKPEGTQHTMYSDYRRVGEIMVSHRQETLELPTGMKNIAEFTLVEFDIPVDESLFEPPGEDVEDFRFVSGQNFIEVPFQYIENHIYLPVEVGGKTRLWILDTGASMTCIEEEFAKELGLKIEGQIKGQGAGNLVDVSFTDLPAFSLPGLEFDQQKAAVLELNWLFHKWIDRDIGGILGYDFLSRLVIKVDYANEMLTFYHPDHFQYRGLGTVLDAPLTESNAFHLPITVEGEHTGEWNLDLGASGMSFYFYYSHNHGFQERPGIDGLSFGAGGSQKKRSILAGTVEFAGYIIDDLVISMPAKSGDVGFGTDAIDGNIGNTLLEHFVLYLDYKREQVIVEKGENFGKVFPRDNSGMQIIRSDEGNLEVLNVAEGTPAAKAGFREGDILTSVNDLDTEHLGGVVAMKKLMQQPPGTKYSIGIEREGEPKELKLTLKDLYR
jgi:hypothetical protein